MPAGLALTGCGLGQTVRTALDMKEIYYIMGLERR